MAFTKFIDYGAASRHEATLRVNKTLFISKSMLTKFGVSNSKSAILYIDDNKKRLGIEFSSKIENEGRKISVERSGISINIAPILRFYNIEVKERKKLSVIIESGKLIIDL
jgi:hypothetical protein